MCVLTMGLLRLTQAHLGHGSGSWHKYQKQYSGFSVFQRRARQICGGRQSYGQALRWQAA